MLQYITNGRLKCESPTGQIFIIQASVLKNLKYFMQLKPSSPESGGILIGRTDINTKSKIIETFTQPMEGDRQTRTTFYRSKSHQHALKRIWNESEQSFNFQGLWHTHPEDTPSPSPTDLIDISNVINSISDLEDPVLYLILGRIKLGIWISFKNHKIMHLGYINIETENATRSIP